MYGKPDKQSGAYQVGVQLSCGVCAKVPKRDHLQPVQSRFAGDHTDAVQVQGSGDSGREHDTGSRTSANQYTAKVERIFMGHSKGKSALMMFDKHANLKYKFGNRHFWSEGYYVSTVGMNEATIKKYIEEQEKHDIAMDKLSVREYEEPFKGSK